MSIFRILLADDHPVFRLGLCCLLGSHEGLEICGQAADGREAVEKCSQLKPDLLILDIGMPELNGVDAARRILINNPLQRILVLTDVRSEQAIRDCLEAGVRGWVYKSDDPVELIAAVEELKQDRSSFSSGVCELILNGYLLSHRPGPVAPDRALRRRSQGLERGCRKAGHVSKNCGNSSQQYPGKAQSSLHGGVSLVCSAEQHCERCSLSSNCSAGTTEWKRPRANCSLSRGAKSSKRCTC